MNKLVMVLLLSVLSVSLGRPQAEEDYDYAQNEDYYETVEEPTEETVVEAAPSFVEQSQTLTVVEGSSVSISCRTEDPTQNVLMFTKKNEKDAGQNRLLFTDNTAIYQSRFTADALTYTLASARRENAGTYYCTYQAPSGDAQVTYELDVQYAPSVKPMDPSMVKVLKGDSVNFDCEASGNPQPTITWSRENQMLPSGVETETGGSIMLLEVDRHVEGTYICTADNGIGDPAFATKKLMVEYEPEIITEKEIIRTGEGDKVELVCMVHARPKAIVEWSKEGNDSLSPDEDIQEIDGSHRHSIILSHVTEADYGSYTCSATNTLGSSAATVNLTDLPRQPHFTSDPTGAEENQYTLTWETESFYPITEYQLKYRPSMANATDSWMEESVDVSADQVETDDLLHSIKHTITDLTPATDYDIMVSVKNQNKWGNVETFKFSTRKASPTTTTPLPSEVPAHEENASHITAGASYVTFSLGMLLCSMSAHLIS